MARWLAFWEALVKSFGWVSDLPEKSEKLKKLGPFVLWLLAAIGYSVKDISWVNWWPWLQPWSQFLLVGVVAFIAWKTAIAWYTSAGTIIRLKEFGIDENYSMLDLLVAKDGPGETVIAYVYAVDLRDAKGRRIPRIDVEIPIHWRGLRYGEKMRLYHDKHGIAGVLEANQTTTGCPVVFLTTPPLPDDAPGFYRLAPLLTEETPLAKQQKLRLTLRIDFCDEKDEKKLRTKTCGFSIIPDDKLKCYRIRIGWWKKDLLLPIKATIAGREFPKISWTDT